MVDYYELEYSARILNNGMFTIVTSNHGHWFLKSLIGRETNGSPTLFYTRSPKTKVTMGENVNKRIRMGHGILRIHKWMLFGGHTDFATKEPQHNLSMENEMTIPYINLLFTKQTNK